MATNRKPSRPAIGHGGRRPGAGRKHIDPEGNTIKIELRLTRRQLVWLDSRGDNRAATIRSLIDQASDA